MTRRRRRLPSATVFVLGGLWLCGSWLGMPRLAAEERQRGAGPAASFRDALAAAGLGPADLRVGAEADWLGHPPSSAIPFVLPHLEPVRRDPTRLVVLGTNLLHVARAERAKSPPERGISRLFTAYVLQPRLPGFRGLPIPPPDRTAAAGPSFDDLPPELRPAVEDLVAALVAASARVDRSWHRLAPEVVDRAATTRDVPLLLPGGSAWWPAIDDAARGGDDVDRAAAALLVLTAIERAVVELAGVDPAVVDRWERTTPQGKVIVAGRGKHRHQSCDLDCLLVLDLAGDDVYVDTASGAALAGRQPVSVTLDLAGDDHYEAGGSTPAQGAGLGGVGVVVDLAGDDHYEAGDRAQGFGLLGYGILWDRGGRDRYEGGGGVQGSAVLGGGLLVDEEGADVYRLLGEGQGFGGPGACGALVDLAGDDEYFAEPEPEYDEGRGDDHSGGRVAANNAQGAGVGRRGDQTDGHVWAGGVGILADLAGDDRYRAGNFAQAMGFWYGTGLLLDDRGDDVYESVYFSQGSGAHFSLALLWDGAGNDLHRLTEEAGASLAYGWDFALSLLVDAGGNDVYRAAKTVLGTAQLSSVSLFLELGGRDTYDVAVPAKAFGWSGPAPPVADGGPVRAATLASQVGLFVDLGGEDRYPVAERPANGRSWTTGLDDRRGVEVEPLRWLTPGNSSPSP